MIEILHVSDYFAIAGLVIACLLGWGVIKSRLPGDPQENPRRRRLGKILLAGAAVMAWLLSFLLFGNHVPADTDDLQAAMELVALAENANDDEDVEPLESGLLACFKSAAARLGRMSHVSRSDVGALEDYFDTLRHRNGAIALARLGEVDDADSCPIPSNLFGEVDR